MTSWLLGRRGPSGFSWSSTADQITQGISAAGLTAIVTGPYLFLPPTSSSSFSNSKSHPKTPLITFTNNPTQPNPIQGHPAASAPRRRGRWRCAGPTSSWPSGASPLPRPSRTPSSPRRRRPSSTLWSWTSRPWPPSAPSRPNSSTGVSPSTSSCMYSVHINYCLLCCQPSSFEDK